MFSPFSIPSSRSLLLMVSMAINRIIKEIFGLFVTTQKFQVLSSRIMLMYMYAQNEPLIVSSLKRERERERELLSIPDQVTYSHSVDNCQQSYQHHLGH